MALDGFDYNVSWSDFNHLPTRPQSVDEDAETHSKFPHSYQFGRNKNAVIVTGADVNISMISSLCWVVSSRKSDLLLNHEQGHYDITALGAREFYNKLLALKAQNENKMERSIKELNARLQQKINTINIRYDTQTDHSQNAGVQQAWDKQIAAEKQKPDGSLDNLPT